MGILAWLIGGCIMIICAYTFAVMATKYEKVNGIVDYAEAAVGKTYGYFVGWFMAVIYYPALTGVLSWVSARYTCVLFGWDIVGPQAMVLTLFYMVLSFGLNTLAPVLSGKFQVSTTVIKLIPLYLMAIVGTIFGLKNGVMIENFTTVANSSGSKGNALFIAVVATAFAYEGWIIATSINSELKNAKKNLPRALVGGTFIIMATYILYYIGLAGAVTNKVMMEGGEEGARIAFETIFSKVAGTGVFVLIVISCLGTLNGLMLACTRGLYAIAVRNEGPRPDILGQVADKVNMPINASIAGLVLCGTWFTYFYGANLTKPWFGFFSFDASELPIVTIYALYLPIFVMIMVKEKSFGGFKRFVAPVLSIIGSIFMVYAACFSHRMGVVYYLTVFAVVMIIGAVVKNTPAKYELK